MAKGVSHKQEFFESKFFSRQNWAERKFSLNAYKLGMKKKPVFFKIRIPDWNRTLGLKIRIFPDLVIQNFHKLSAEKRIMKIGQNLAEL